MARVVKGLHSFTCQCHSGMEWSMPLPSCVNIWVRASDTSEAILETQCRLVFINWVDLLTECLAGKRNVGVFCRCRRTVMERCNARCYDGFTLDQNSCVLNNVTWWPPSLTDHVIKPRDAGQQTVSQAALSCLLLMPLSTLQFRV